jgi:hypothetical protein
MQSRVRWATAILGIAIVGVMLFGIVPSTNFVGGAGAALPTHGGVSAVAGAPKATLEPAATTHGSQGPHPGTLEIWEASSGGPETVDPSICYYTVCDEPISNVYETLIAYNGTDDGPTPTNYVPQLATCVPGSLECAAQFGGNDLVFANSTTGAPQYYTFEIDAGARFYDSAHGTKWPVYPSDVVFTFERTMGFSELWYEEQTNGWINTQDLVPVGNSDWDGGIHAPLNNTPQHILGAFLVNDSSFCPESDLVATNGCVTFDVGASGHDWPFFLELIADNLGASIQSCGWDTEQGASVPGFLGSNASEGDGPCLLPGNSTSTTQSGFQNYLVTTPYTGWDSFEEEANNWPADQPSIQWNDVGSGPYYVDNPIDADIGYTLTANPYYSAPVGCAGQPGCLPYPGNYIPNVDVVWENGTVGDETGLTEMSVGQADSAGFFSNDLPTVESYSRNYSVLADVPGLTIGFFPFTLDFNVTNEQMLDQTGLLNVPGTFFQNDALRQFLVHAYPYRTIEGTYDTVNGTAFGEGYGGAIPRGLGPYYDPDIDWPQGNPAANSSVVGNVSWWWEVANNGSSPYYDSQLVDCNSTDPCRWATFSYLGDTTLDDVFNDWNAEVANLSGGSLQPYLVDLGSCPMLGCCYLGYCPGGSALTVYNFGWAPDYPDPSDFVAPMYYPDNSFTYPDAVSESLAAAPNNASSCPDDYGAKSNLTYWAGLGEIPADCQGAAYDTMVAWMNLAAYEPSPALRIVEYDLIEQIANELALYVYDPQSLGAVDYGNWIEPSTINANPVNGGGEVQLWYGWNYLSNYFNATFSEVGLPVGTSWNLTVGQTQYASGGSAQVTVRALTNGSYSFTIGMVPGFTSDPVGGVLVISGSDGSVFVTFTAIGSSQFVLAFNETGLPSGTNWTVALTPEGPGAIINVSGNGSTITVPVEGGNYTYAPGPVPGYATPPAGSVDVTASPTTVLVDYQPVFPVEFSETGLVSNSSWAVTLGGQLEQTASDELTFSEPNGTFSFVVAPIQGVTVSPASGNVTVTGAPVSVALDFAVIPVRFSIAFSEEGLPAGTTWWISLDGMEKTSPGPTIVFSEENGTYAYVVGPVPGYSSSDRIGSVLLVGVNQTVTIAFTSHPAATGFLGLSISDWAAVLLATAVAGGLVLFALRSRLRSKPPLGSSPNAAPLPNDRSGGPVPGSPRGTTSDADRWRPAE